MIRSLRRTHRASVLALALLLPPAYAAALLARPAAEPAVSFPAKDAPTFRVAADAFGRLVLELDARGAPVVPDALVYWAPAAASEPALPGDAVLLGALPADAVRAFNLPFAARQHRGVALVFSLAWQKRVAEMPLP
jgi:hypothetical protein